MTHSNLSRRRLKNGTDRSRNTNERFDDEKANKMKTKVTRVLSLWFIIFTTNKYYTMGLFGKSKYSKFEQDLPDVSGKVFAITGMSKFEWRRIQSNRYQNFQF